MQSLTILPGSQGALRGYRLQHLYALHRLLCTTNPGALALQLEGTEDMEVYDAAGTLLEAVQVKALSSKNLTASVLFSEGGDSFFRRAAQRLTAYPKAKQTVVSFGPFGPRLLGAEVAHSVAQSELERLLKSKGFRKNDVGRLLTAIQQQTIHFEEADEARIEADVMQRLQKSIASANPEAAFTFLSGWLWLASENKARLTSEDVRHRLEAIGAFLTVEAAKHHEWYSTIVPLGEQPTSNEDRVRLHAEFYEGTYTRYEHVASNLDVDRPDMLNAITAAFAKNNVVVVHGASGQGKTALAYRYIIDRTKGAWTFEVRVIENDAHALRVARVLADHARAMGIKLMIYVDVAPRNLHWMWLVREISSVPQACVLVTVREEDWARARIEGLQLEVADVELDFREAEARVLYAGLAKERTPPRFLNFEDAWANFRYNGPLLEFVYLITQSVALQDRLAAQVRRLRDEVRSGKLARKDLELLRRVVVASAYAARLSLRRLESDLDMPDIGATLELFEREYLLRRSEGGDFLEGLHPIRSEFLSNLLTRDDSPTTWAKTACACMSAMAEPDIYGFLRSAFSSRHEDTAELLAKLDEQQPVSWTGFAGTFRALMWLGLREYATNCQHIIQESEKSFGNRSSILLPFDPADVSARWPDLFPQFEKFDWIREDAKKLLADLKTRLPSKTVVSTHAREWLLRRRGVVASPQTLTDWSGAAEVTFWAGYWGIDHQVKPRLTATDVRAAFPGLPFNIATDVWFAMSFADIYRDIRIDVTVHRELVERFQREHLVSIIEDDGNRVCAHFVLDITQIRGSLNDETMRRVDALRKIFPTREVYASQGYGHMFPPISGEHDATTKNINVSYLLPEWLPRTNRSFSKEIEAAGKADSWKTYAESVYATRKCVIDFADSLRDGLQRYFRSRSNANALDTWISGEMSNKLRESISAAPDLPRSADYETEDGVPADDSGIQARLKDDVDRYRKSIDNYMSSLKSFVEQSQLLVACNPRIGRPQPGQDRMVLKKTIASLGDIESDRRLSISNLHDATVHLARFQRLFRERMSIFFDRDTLATLEAKEQSTLVRLWCVWHEFALHPSKTTAFIDNEAFESFKRPIEAARRSLRKSFQKSGSTKARASILTESVRWEDERALWITVDVWDPTELYEALQIIVTALHEAIGHNDGIADLKYYAYSYWWNSIHVIPLVRGKAVEPQGWRFPVIVLPRPNDTRERLALKFWPQPIPAGTWEQLGLALWDDARLDVGRRFRSAVGELQLLLAHLLCLREIPEPDDLGRNILREYGQKKTSVVLQTQTTLSVAIDDMAKYVLELGDERLKERRYLAQVIPLLVELERQTAIEQRRDEGQTDMDLIEAWLQRVRAAASSAEFAWLAWIGDVLDEQSATGAVTARP